MKKFVVLLFALFMFGCSDDEESPVAEDNGQWAIIFHETSLSDSDPVSRTEKFLFNHERLMQHSVKQRYLEEETTHEVNLSYSDNQVVATANGTTYTYTINADGYASQCTCISSFQNRTYSFSYSNEGYLTGIVESIDDTEYSSASITYDNGDITSVSSALAGHEPNKLIYEPGEGSTRHHLPCLGLLEVSPLAYHVEALYGGLLGKTPNHFTVRTSPEGNSNEHTDYTYEFDEEGKTIKIGCRTIYDGNISAGYSPYIRNVSVSYE